MNERGDHVPIKRVSSLWATVIHKVSTAWQTYSRTTRASAFSALLGMFVVALAVSTPLAPNGRVDSLPGMAVPPRLLLLQTRPTTTQTAQGAMNGWVNELHPVDPQTLADSPGYTPLSLD